MKNRAISRVFVVKMQGLAVKWRMSLLEVSFFGTFQMKVGDVPIANFRSVNTQGLLAYLILQAERPFPRDTLATLFWPDVPDATAKKNLRQTLYQLRQLLNDSDKLPQPFLFVSRQNIQWNPESDYWLDVQAFLADLAHGELETAVTHYTGELLPGFTCDSLDFENWLRQERERLHRLALTALDDLTERYITQADLAAAEAAAPAPQSGSRLEMPAKYNALPAGSRSPSPTAST